MMQCYAHFISRFGPIDKVPWLQYDAWSHRWIAEQLWSLWLADILLGHDAVSCMLMNYCAVGVTLLKDNLAVTILYLTEYGANQRNLRVLIGESSCIPRGRRVSDHTYVGPTVVVFDLQYFLWRKPTTCQMVCPYSTAARRTRLLHTEPCLLDC